MKEVGGGIMLLGLSTASAGLGMVYLPLGVIAAGATLFLVGVGMTRVPPKDGRRVANR